jgi:hypothetical protein
LLFLLLAAKTITEDNNTILGFPKEITSDYYKLCEYIHYHHGELFYLDFGRENSEKAAGSFVFQRISFCPKSA